MTPLLSATSDTSLYSRLSLFSILLILASLTRLTSAAPSKDDEFNVRQITDEDSLQENLDSIFEGSIIAIINSTSPCLPRTYKFGPYRNARLTIGPNHRPGMDPNPYFLSFAGGEDGEFSGGMQSSITSHKVNDTYWALQAWEQSEPAGTYQITGTLLKSADEKLYWERNGFGGILPGKFGKDNKDEEEEEDEDDIDTKNRRRRRWIWDKRSEDCKDEPKFLTWAHTEDATILHGIIDPKQTRMTLSGTITVTYQTDEKADDDGGDDKDDEDDDGRQRRALYPRQGDKDDRNTVELEYTITFTGEHNSDTAPLPRGGLKWNTPGSGTPPSVFKYPKVSAEDLEAFRETTTTTTSTTRRPSSTRTSTTATSTPTTTPTTSPNKDGEKDPEEEDPGLPKGSIIAIVLGTVLALILLAAAIFFGRAWLEKRKQPKVYPELAYIYSTPFTVRNSNKKSGTPGRGAYGQLKDGGPDTAYRGSGGGGGVGREPARMSGAMTGFGKETGLRDSYYPEDTTEYYGSAPAAPGGGGGSGYTMAGGRGGDTPAWKDETTAADSAGGDMGMGRVSERVRMEEERGLRQPMLHDGRSSTAGGTSGVGDDSRGTSSRGRSRGDPGESYWRAPQEWAPL